MTQRFHVVIADFVNDTLEPEKQILGDIADIQAMDAMIETDLHGKIEHADAIMMYHNIHISRATISTLKQCKLIVRCGVGYDNVDWKYARECGIPVANVPDYGTEEVADSAIGLLLTLTRGIHLLNSRLQRNIGPWSYSQAAPLPRLRGRNFGLIGMGRIGMATALRAKALGMNVFYFDPHIEDGLDKALGIQQLDTLRELLNTSYAVSLHCPLTEETRHIINGETLALMQPGSYLINTGRGACVDLDAIPEAIASGKLAGAGIDVFPHEPPEADHPLVNAWRDPANPCYDRVIVNPHSAFYSAEGMLDMRVKGAEACRRALLAQKIRNVVN